MTFNRPKSVELPVDLDHKATELHARMSVYIDHYAYKPRDQRDDAKIYEYIYHISYMLACRARMMDSAVNYDEFALYCATKVYGRLISDRQFLPDGDPKKLKKITSILNYIKNSLYGMKVSYQTESFNEIIDPRVGFQTDSLVSDLKSTIQSDYNEGIQDNVIQALRAIPKCVRDIVKSTPYSSNAIMSRRLYISCMLSFLSSMVLPKKLKAKIDKRAENNKDPDELLFRELKSQRDNSVILWKLDPVLTDYVDILVKRIKNDLGETIISIAKAFELSDETIMQIIKSPLSDNFKQSAEEN